ncbi:MAG: metallophosphoesterase [Gemmataceae bacterium]|nr:metallophosphoesterase [Gemmataceae bacterium]
MSRMPDPLVVLLLVGWVGHAYLWTAQLNYLYARPISKPFLKLWRLFTGLVILGFPLLLAAPFVATKPVPPDQPDWSLFPTQAEWAWMAYMAVCLVFGGVVFPVVTVIRLLRRPPAALVSVRADTLDLWTELGPAVVGNGKYPWVARLPLNDVFRVDFTELTLAVPGLPPVWDGLTILVVTDVHFHGTPARAFFDRVVDEVERRWPTPDLVCLAGDYVDTDEHHSWIGPVLGRLKATEGRFAILGNHDEHHDPERVRKAVVEAGYDLLGNGWKEVAVRGERCTVVGHEGPWFAPPPDLSNVPSGPFRLCLSHTPDNFYWGQRHRVGLMLCGHVHGGQIRLPVVTSIFVPSVYGRRFDCGVFEGGGTVMVVGRGLSGKEPLRFRCRPEVIRITLTRPTAVSDSPRPGRAVD